jgi:hypothetical protein
VLYYDLSFAMHIVGALVMIWLVYRIPEHIRIFTYATPFIVGWAVDRIMHEFLFRNTASSVKFVDLDEDYCLMLFTIKQTCPVNIGEYCAECWVYCVVRLFVHCITPNTHYSLPTTHYPPTTPTHYPHPLPPPTTPTHYPHPLRLIYLKPYTGDVYLLKTSMNVLEFSHPYTCFHYRAAEDRRLTSIDVEDGIEEGEEGGSEIDHSKATTTTGLQVIRVGFEADAVSLAGGKLTVASAHSLANQKSYISRASQDNDDTYGCIVRKFGPKSFSQRLCSGFAGGRLSDAFYAIGPYRRIYRRLMRTPQPCPYVLIGE